MFFGVIISHHHDNNLLLFVFFVKYDILWVMEPVVILCDGFRVTGPNRSDGNITISFTTGEYGKEAASEMLKVPQDIVLEVTVKEHKNA